MDNWKVFGIGWESTKSVVRDMEALGCRQAFFRSALRSRCACSFWRIASCMVSTSTCCWGIVKIERRVPCSTGYGSSRCSLVAQMCKRVRVNGGGKGPAARRKQEETSRQQERDCFKKEYGYI